MTSQRARKDEGSQRTVADSRGVYGIRHWGSEYLSINDSGRIMVMPEREQSMGIDLSAEIEKLRTSGLQLPLLVRFPDILQDRLRRLSAAFASGIEKYAYQNSYTPVYPIKVNQQEAVIKSMIATDNVNVGLEAGS